MSFQFHVLLVYMLKMTKVNPEYLSSEEHIRRKGKYLTKILIKLYLQKG